MKAEAPRFECCVELSAMAAELPRVPSHEEIGTIRRPGVVPVDETGDAERMERLRALGYIE